MNGVNKQTNKQTGRREITFWLPIPASEELLEKAGDLVIREKRASPKCTLSSLARDYFIEGVNRHHPGNPTPPLDHWAPNGPPFSEAAQEKLDLTDHHIEADCGECSGSGENRWGGVCRGCNGIGKVGVEKPR
jgi:hypothetical protein